MTKPTGRPRGRPPGPPRQRLSVLITEQAWRLLQTLASDRKQSMTATLEQLIHNASESTNEQKP